MLAPIAAGHKMASFARQPIQEQPEQQSSHFVTSHDLNFRNNYSTTTRHTASPRFISDSLKWLRLRRTPGEILDEPNGNYYYSTATANLLVSKQIKSRYTKKSYFSTSSPQAHKHSLSIPINVLYLPLLALIILNLVQESHGNPAPSGFFISGHAIPCTVGQPVDILHHIPFADPSLRKCYGCSCPAGSVVCNQLEDQSNCDYQRPTAAAKTPVVPSKSIKHNAMGNRVSPTTSLLAHHSHHSRHHGISSPGGKAKGIGVPRKVKTTVTAGTSAQVLAHQAQQSPVMPQQHQQQQQQQHKKSMGTPRSLRPPSNEARAATRSVHHYGRYHSSRQIIAQDPDEEFRLRETVRPPTPFPYVAEILQTPALPIGDPRHHEHAAAALNLPLAKYLEKRARHMKESSDRQTPEPTTTTTTPEPTTTTTTTTASLVEELTEETTDTDQTTATTTFVTTTTTLSGPQEETTTRAPEIINWPSGGDEDQTTDKPNTGDEDLLDSMSPNEMEDKTITADNSPSSASQTTETPSIELIERDPAVVTYDDLGTQMKKSELELTLDKSRPPKSSFDVNNHLNQIHINHQNLMIDTQQANEIMEQVSHDGILYIAIGVEAFILMSIIAMMIIFYMFREKTPPDELPQYHQALQMPRRSPSLEKA